MSPTVFDSHGTDRLHKWKQFRNTLETSDQPWQDVAELWCHAPFVSAYLDPHAAHNWPDPWHLILDGRLDDLAIVLGMLYTIKLTQRFIDTPCEIHMTMSSNDNAPQYLLLIGTDTVLNHSWGQVSTHNDINWSASHKIFAVTRLQ